MRVLLLNQVFYPDVAATAQHAHDLARHLVSRGHEVHAIASRSVYGERGGTLPRYEEVDGIHIHRVGRSLFGKSSIVGRAADFGIFYLAAAWKALRVPRPDVSVCFTTPPFVALLGVGLRALRGSRYVYWVMDLYPDVAVACGVMRAGSVTTRFFDRMNRFALRRADRVVVLGRCMLERVVSKRGVDADRVEHIGVWSDGSEVEPVPRSENPYREEWGLGERFVVMYSGNFGLAHDVGTMLGAAEALRDEDGVRFVFVGGGKRKGEVESFVASRGLSNCVVAPYQPRERLGQSLSAADAHLATMISGAEGTVVPCKLFGIMAAGRPTLFVGSPRSELGRVLAEHDAGVTLEPGDSAGLVREIRALASDPERAERMGANARRALSGAYGREAACERWRVLLESAAGGGGG